MSDLSDLRPETWELIASIEANVAQYPDEDVVAVPDDGDYDHRLIQEQLVSAQVCTRKTPTEAADWLSTVRPPGTSHGRWEFDESLGEVTCSQFPDTHRHVIVTC